MIDANKILQVDVLDLIFEGRNKEYGAYELRTNYGKRLLIAMFTMLGVCCCMILLNSFAGKPGKNGIIIVDTITLVDVERIEPPIKPPPVEPPPPQEQVKQVKFTSPPIITPNEVKPEDEVPPIDEVETAKIGPIQTDGRDDDGLTAPPVKTDGTGVTELPKPKEEDPDKIVLDVQIQSEYPGGLSAWLRYLTKNLPKHYSDDLVERGIQGRVVVQFIVDREGNVSEVQGIEGPAELREIGEIVIRKSGKWTPAIQNGRQVKSYKRQPITFALPEE